jgi:hypothetical protein
MSTGLRCAIYAVCALLWMSGCAWLVLHFAFPTATGFGPAPNPWEPVLLRIHGWVAVCGVFLFGWITANHISDRWRKSPKRVSGFSLAGFVVILTASGYALYYTTDRLHDVAGTTHEAMGAVAIVFAFAHWWRNNARSSSNRQARNSVQ